MPGTASSGTNGRGFPQTSSHTPRLTGRNRENKVYFQSKSRKGLLPARQGRKALSRPCSLFALLPYLFSSLHPFLSVFSLFRITPPDHPLLCGTLLSRFPELCQHAPPFPVYPPHHPSTRRRPYSASYCFLTSRFHIAISYRFLLSLPPFIILCKLE